MTLPASSPSPERHQLAVLAQVHPAALACLSELGRRAIFPRGIPVQAAEAAGSEIDATIGQITDGAGRAVPLPLIRDLVGDLQVEEAVLYASQGGRAELRQAWLNHLRAPGGLDGISLSRPVVTAGLTHGLFLMGDLVVDPGRRVLLPSPGWGNYRQIFGTRQAGRLENFPLLRGDRLAVDEILEIVNASDEPTLMVVNFPSNPLGFSPSKADAEALAQGLKDARCPLTVVCDDAYLGMCWDSTGEALDRSFFELIADADPSRLLAAKVDGATKELFLFGARIGFLTFAASAAASVVLEDKLKALARSSISSASAWGQAAVLRALRSPELKAQREVLLDSIRARHDVLHDALKQHGLACFPFNSGFFALLPAEEPEAVRQALLAQSIGVVALPEAGAIRISYGSVNIEALPKLVDALARALA